MAKLSYTYCKFTLPFSRDFLNGISSNILKNKKNTDFNIFKQFFSLTILSVLLPNLQAYSRELKCLRKGSAAQVSQELMSTKGRVSASFQKEIKCKLFVASFFISPVQAAEWGQSDSSSEAEFVCLCLREHEHFVHVLIEWSQLKNWTSFHPFWSAFLNWSIFREQEKRTEIQLSWGSAFHSPPGVFGHAWAFLFLIHRVLGLRSSPHFPGFTPPKTAVTGDPPAVDCIASSEALEGCMPGPWERQWLRWACTAFGANELVSTV